MGDSVPARRSTERLLLHSWQWRIRPVPLPGSQDAHRLDMKTRATVRPVDRYLPYRPPPATPPALKQQEADGAPHQSAQTGVADTTRPPGDAPSLSPLGTWPIARRPLGRVPSWCPAGCGPLIQTRCRTRARGPQTTEDPTPHTLRPGTVFPEKWHSRISAFHLGADTQPRQACC